MSVFDLLPKPLAGGPRQRIDRILERRTFDELQGVARELELRFEQRHRRVVILLGVRGVGKTTVGQQLAQRLGMPFVELDDRVAAFAGLPLAELISVYGERYYRQIEHQCLTELLINDQPVVVAAGGVVEHLQSHDLLLRCALTVYLSASAETLWTRVLDQGDNRPMSGRETALAQLRLLLLRREPLYAKAQIRLVTDGRLVTRLVSDLVEEIQLLRADRAQLRQGQ